MNRFLTRITVSLASWEARVLFDLMLPLRSTILYLSRQRALQNWVETSSAARHFSTHFVAGLTLDDAIAVCVRFRSEGIMATLDYLGENVKSLDEGAACRDMYSRC